MMSQIIQIIQINNLSALKEPDHDVTCENGRSVPRVKCFLININISSQILLALIVVF